ncbi:hypothetical protein OSB04_028596 [Centaurea solstitialis]|uniref:Reverse transcriptase n=1 Tax=Centaurea solstitialis TaxID=347529 RepID=A0AA38W7V9_9ASTR|nr:hypothetical protein OSB04_028596 [Centaurea solstitialis]
MGMWPNGFSFAFIKSFWNIVGPDFIKEVYHFAKYSHINQGCNDPFIALIPKLKDPLSLAERLKKVINSVISPEQMAYVKGKNLVDGPLIVNELIAWDKQTKDVIIKTEENSLCKDVIIAIHGPRDLVGKQIRNGLNTSFWHEIWCEKESLGDRYPRLGALDRQIDCCVADRFGLEGTGTMRWNWIRPLTGKRELKQLEELENFCRQTHLCVGVDSWSWRMERIGIFSVSSLRTALDDLSLEKCRTVTGWNVVVPRKQENTNHIFATCSKSTEVRKLVNKWWDVLAEDCDNTNDVFGSFQGMKQASKDEIIRDA